MRVAAALVWAATWLVACGAARAGEVLDAIRARGTLLVGTTGDYKPFSFRNPDGSYVGADIDMARLYAAHLGVRPVFVPTAWGQLNGDFAAKKFDIAVGGVTNLPPRAAIAPFSTTTYVDGKRPIARCADRDRYVSVAAIDRPAVRVVVNPGASNEDFARANFPPRAADGASRQRDRVRRDRRRPGGRDGDRRDRGRPPGLPASRPVPDRGRGPRSPGWRRPTGCRTTPISCATWISGWGRRSSPASGSGYWTRR